uniref:Uncharacterized protein n=1 Tax=Anopheles christyi TaxID=43041 RepID=A0A182JWQ3_9DIPT
MAIYREIKSNSRAVAACIRSYERDRKSASSASGKGSLTPDVEASLGSSNSTSGHNSSVVPSAEGKGKENSGGGGVKGLERRYHLLYLKAFEIQCLLEGLLDSKTSSSDNNASLSDTDEEPANKVARVSSSSIKSQGSNHNDTLNNEEWVKVKKLSNAGFDADSEGSDSEIVPNIIAYSGAGNAYNSSSQKQEAQYHPGTAGSSISSSAAVASTSSPSSGNLMMEADINNLSTTTTLSDATTLTTTSSKAAEAANAAIIVLKENLLNNNHNHNTTIESEKSLIGCDLVDGTALLSSTLDTVNNNGTTIVKEHSTDRHVGNGSSLRNNVKASSPIGSSGKQKRPKVSDSSKFNRSNRKSKNCATFYFKHLDTDSELNKDSSERTKSDASSPGTSSPSASSSEGDDEWVYNNGEEEEEDELLAVRKARSEEEEKENQPDGPPVVDKHQREELGTSALNMTAGREPKSKKCLDFSRDASQKGGASTPGGRNGGRSLMMTSIGSFGKGMDSVNGTKGSKYATSSIQRLVLHAETLVRDEIFAKNAAAAAAAAAGTTPKTVVKNPHYYHHHHHHHHNYSANNSSSNNSNSSHHHQQQCSLPSSLSGVGAVASHEPQSSRHGATAHSQHHHHHHHHGHGRKAEKAMSNLKMNLIEEWLEKQPLDAPVSAPLLPASVPTTDCEASGEYTDSDSIARDTDSSEGLANSVATCLQGEQTQTSQELLNDGTSYPSENSNDDEGVATDSKGGSSAALTTTASTGATGVTAASSSPSLSTSAVHHGSGIGSGSVSTVVKRRPHRSATDRPWSVSCMSQLNSSSVEINQYGGTSEQDSGSGGGGGGADGGGDGAGNNPTGHKQSGTSSGGNDSNRPLTDHRNFSISESALNTMARCGAGSGLSMVGSRGSMKPTSSQQTVVRNSESKGSLKKRKLRPRRKNRIDESGSDESQPPQHSSSTLHLLQLLQYNALAAGSGQPLREIQLSGTGGSNSSGGAVGGAISTSSSRRLLKSESFSGRLRLSDDLLTLSSLSGSSSRKSSSVWQSTPRSTKRSQDSEEEFGCPMAKPEFRIGSLTRTRCGSLNLGSLAALANYNLDGVEKAETDLNGTGTGTEEMSSFSEQAWDNYQEKYMSEPYSEDRDTDAARRLLDFGDDYRNFIDSQSDCASSSLSAANMDSLSPPRFRLKSESANKSDATTNSLNRRKRLDEYRMDDRYGNNMNSWSSKSGSPPQSTSNVGGRKHGGSLSFLEATPLAPMAESSVSGLNGLSAGTASGGVRRRSLRSVDKHNTSAAFVRSLSHETSSSSNNEFDEDMEAEVKKLLIQSKIRFANTEALKAKCHLLKPDDYSEIITTCRENVRCLESVLRCQPGTVLTAAKCQDLRGKRIHQRAQTSRSASPIARAEKKEESEDGQDSGDYSEDGSESDGDSTISCSDRSTDSYASTLGRQSEIEAASHNQQQQQPWNRCAGQRGGGGSGRVTACRRQADRIQTCVWANGRQDGGCSKEGERQQEYELPQTVVRQGRGRLVRPRNRQKKVIVVREECRCARITRFIAWLIDFLLDIGNVMRNFTLYRFFVGVLNGFYRLVDFFGWSAKNEPAPGTAAITTSAVGSGSESGVGSLTSASAATFVNTKALARGADDILKRLTIGII